MNLQNKAGVSFIIPCYNCSSTLVESIESIINIGLHKFEICLVDDCSTDGTWKIIQEYYKKHPGVFKVAKNKKNLGGGATRNACVKLSTNKFIFCLDSDNVLNKDSFLKLWSRVNKETTVLAFGEIRFFIDFLFLDIVVKKWIFNYRNMSLSNLFLEEEHQVSSGNYMFSRSVFNKIGGYEEDLGALDSYSFGYKLLLAGYNIEIVPKTYYMHRLNLNSYWVREKSHNIKNTETLYIRFPVKSKILSKKVTKSKIVEPLFFKLIKLITNKHG